MALTYRSEMYKIGEPCSACPPGTSCSERYPGLCSGDPEGPVTIRPPLRNGTGVGVKLTFGCVMCKSRNLIDQNLFPPEHPFISRDWYGPEGLVDEEVVRRKKRPTVVQLPPVLIEGPSRGVDKCRYECAGDGGCSVRFITR